MTTPTPCTCPSLDAANEDAARLAAVVKSMEYSDEAVFCPDCHAFLEDPHIQGCEIRSALDLHDQRLGGAEPEPQTPRFVACDALPAGAVLFISPGPLFGPDGKPIDENVRRLVRKLTNVAAK